MKKLENVIIIFLVTCLILLVGCNKVVQDKKVDELTGSISIAVDNGNEQIIKSASEKFMSNNPKVNIKIQPVDTVSLLSSKGDAYKNYDLYMTGEENLQKILNLNSKLFYDLSNNITQEKGSIAKNFTSNNSYNGKIYGYPWYTYSYVIYYRQDLFKDAGISIEDIKTWQQFIDASAKVNKATGKKILTQESSGNIYSIMLNQLRGDYVDKNGKSLISSNASLKALTVESSLYSGALLYSSSNISNEIKNDKVMAVLGNSSDMSLIPQGNPNLKGKWKLIQLPAFEPGGNRSVTFGGSSMLLNNSSKNSKLTLDFLQFCSNDKDVNIMLSKSFGTVPICIDVSQSEDLKKPNDFFNNNNVYELYENIGRLAPLVNYTAKYNLINSVLQQNISKLQGNTLDINSFANNVQQELNAKINIEK